MQSSYRPGVIATTLDRLAPIGQLADAVGLQRWINGFVDWAIGQYQRYLSPAKASLAPIANSTVAHLVRATSGNW
jgi:hypothetical protein